MTVTTVTGNNGSVSCRQWCFMNNYATTTSNNPDKIHGTPIDCICDKANITALTGNNGTISCKEYINRDYKNQGYTFIGAYYNNIPVSLSKVPGQQTVQNAWPPFTCYVVKDIDESFKFTK